MPYRASGVWVLVERNGKWSKWRKAKSPEKAKAQATAMNMEYARKEGKDVPPRKD